MTHATVEPHASQRRNCSVKFEILCTVPTHKHFGRKGYYMNKNKFLVMVILCSIVMTGCGEKWRSDISLAETSRHVEEDIEQIDKILEPYGYKIEFITHSQDLAGEGRPIEDYIEYKYKVVLSEEEVIFMDWINYFGGEYCNIRYENKLADNEEAQKNLNIELYCKLVNTVCGKQFTEKEIVKVMEGKQEDYLQDKEDDLGGYLVRKWKNFDEIGSYFMYYFLDKDRNEGIMISYPSRNRIIK